MSDFDKALEALDRIMGRLSLGIRDDPTNGADYECVQSALLASDAAFRSLNATLELLKLSFHE